jgi:hypothetical protein
MAVAASLPDKAVIYEAMTGSRRTPAVTLTRPIEFPLDMKELLPVVSNSPFVWAYYSSTPEHKSDSCSCFTLHA